MLPTVATPASLNPSVADAPIATVIAINGAGERGAKRSSAKMITSTQMAIAIVATEACGSSCAIANKSRKNPVFSICTPSSFGIWSTTITNPMADLKPVRTGSEMKFATKPSLSTDAATSITPVRTASVALATIRAPESPPGTARPSSAATRIASVVVVLTLSGRDVPSSA